MDSDSTPFALPPKNRQLRRKPAERVEPMWAKLSMGHKAIVAARLGATRGGPPVPVECVTCGKPGQLTWTAPYDQQIWRGTRRVGQQVRLTERLEWDHIVPLRWGGLHDPDNIQILCNPCNLRKGATR